MAAAAASEVKIVRPMRHSSSYQLIPPTMSELRVVLLGNCWSERSSVGNLILGETKFTSEDEPNFVTIRGQMKEKEIVLINTPDVLDPNISEEKLTEFIVKCVSLSDPGPHVFLLVLQPEDFTEEHKLRLCRVLQLFSDQSFDQSLILISTPREESSASMDKDEPDQPLKDMIRMCRYRYLKQKNLELPELLTRLSQTAKENNGDHVSCEVTCKDEDGGLFMELKSDHHKPALNLVLCGRRGALKTSAAKALLGQTEFHSVSNSSVCVRNQGEVCGCRVSLVELPALYGKPQETVIEESLRCISLCDPEGVHAFILVLPVDALTDEDKGELETIQNTFSPQVDDFTVILFTVESDRVSPVVNVVKENKHIQELYQSCGGRCTVLNIKDKQQIRELLETMRAKGSRYFTKDMFTKAQMEKVVKQEDINTRLKAELQDVKQRNVVQGESQSRECLRMVLIGKTGRGKSATANTILGKKHFKPRIPPKPVTKSCEKATGEIEGSPVVVVINPVLFDETLPDDDVEQELLKCISMLSPGPHVFLLVMQIGNITQEERNCVEVIKKYFGKKAGDFIIIIFTRGDELDNQSFESYVEGCDVFVRELITDCGGRCQVFNNKDDKKRKQVSELITKMKNMVEKNGGCYRTEEFIQIQVERILKKKEEGMKRKYEALKRKHEEDLKTLKRKIDETEQEKKWISKQLKDKDECIGKEREERKKERDEEDKRRKKQEETQRQEWRKKLEASEKIVQSEREQRENAERKLELCRKENKRDRDAWDKERKDIWERIRQEDKQSLEEGKASYRKLQEEYQHKRRKWTYSLFALLMLLLFLLYNVFLSYTDTPQTKEHA